jgi:hypothetical protein
MVIDVIDANCLVISASHFDTLSIAQPASAHQRDAGSG